MSVKYDFENLLNYHQRQVGNDYINMFDIPYFDRNDLLNINATYQNYRDVCCHWTAYIRLLLKKFKYYRQLDETIHIDHIYPVVECFNKNISLSQCNNISNLQFLTAVDNKNKSGNVYSYSLLKDDMDDDFLNGKSNNPEFLNKLYYHFKESYDKSFVKNEIDAICFNGDSIRKQIIMTKKEFKNLRNDI